MKTIFIHASLLSSLVLVGCASPKILYVDPNAINTLTTNFSQNDLRATAHDMTTQLIQSGKMSNCSSYTISPVKNSTDQYIDTSVMTNAMADRLSNSSAVNSTYVLASDEMGNQLDELNRQEQSGLYDQSTTARAGRMKGAQCRIDGKLTSDTSIAPDGKTKVIAYTFFVQVFDIQNGTAIWRNSKNISKSLTY